MSAVWESATVWQVRGPNDSVWCETGDPVEARAMMRPGDRLFRLWRRLEQEWREVDVPAATAFSSLTDD